MTIRVRRKLNEDDRKLHRRIIQIVKSNPELLGIDRRTIVSSLEEPIMIPDKVLPDIVFLYAIDGRYHITFVEVKGHETPGSIGDAHAKLQLYERFLEHKKETLLHRLKNYKIPAQVLDVLRGEGYTYDAQCVYGTYPRRKLKVFNQQSLFKPYGYVLLK